MERFRSTSRCPLRDCHRIGERVTADAIVVRVSGDEALATDILESASVLATL